MKLQNRHQRILTHVLITTASVIVCAGMIWFACELEKQRSPHKITGKVYQEIIK